jgi:inhibitor of cysteine peptidase
MTEIKLTRNENGKSIEAQVGETVLIELPENPTTGYFWTQYGSRKGNGLCNQFLIKAVNNSEIGGKGTRTFILDVRSSGTATIEVKLRIQWEPESAAIDRFNAVIKAR